MKLTNELKKKIENASSAEEVKTILNNIKSEAEKAGIILDDEDLDKIAGGAQGSDSYKGHSPGGFQRTTGNGK